MDPNQSQNQQPYQQQYQYQQQPQYQQPRYQLDTSRSLVKYILLSIVTLGIYGIYVMTKVSTDINIIASRYDGKKTMNFCLLTFVFSWLTLGIYPLVWYHMLSNRIGDELRRRGFAMEFSAETFWLWNVLGSVIIVGPFIYMHKLLTAMNQLSDSYNRMG